MRIKSLTGEVDAIEERWFYKRVDYRLGKIEFRQCTGLFDLRYREGAIAHAVAARPRAFPP
jgi:hypothetical protein